MGRDTWSVPRCEFGFWMVVVVVLFGRVKMFLPPICKVFNVMCFGRHGTKGRGTKKKEESGSGSGSGSGVHRECCDVFREIDFRGEVRQSWGSTEREQLLSS